jgi:hypothetical protein
MRGQRQWVLGPVPSTDEDDQACRLLDSRSAARGAVERVYGVCLGVADSCRLRPGVRVHARPGEDVPSAFVLVRGPKHSGGITPENQQAAVFGRRALFLPDNQDLIRLQFQAQPAAGCLDNLCCAADGIELLHPAARGRRQFDRRTRGLAAE